MRTVTAPSSCLQQHREAVCFKKKASTRTVPRFAVLTFLLPCLAHGPVTTNATVYSDDLRQFADANGESLLFWSAFDFSVDAALQFLGPVDDFLRGFDAPARNCLDPHDISSLACTTSYSKREPATAFLGSVDELVGSVVKNWSLVFTPNEEVKGEIGVGEVNNNINKVPRTVSALMGKPVTVTVPRGGAVRHQQKFSLFQKGDGSETDPDGIPTRYLEMQNGNRENAKKALDATLKWRKEHDVDSILVKPQPKFDIAKQVFPHYFLGRDKNGDILFMQRPALIDLTKAKRNNLKKEDLLMHYVYVNEYLWQILEAHKPLGTMTSIIDLTGLQLGVLRKREMIAFLKLFVQTMDNHFPQRAHKTLLLNAPKWFNTMFKLLSPLMRESTKAKIEIHCRGRKQDEALRKYLSKDACDSLPASFWSKDKSGATSQTRGASVAAVEPEPASLAFNTKLEEELRSYTLSRLKESGKKMINVV